MYCPKCKREYDGKFCPECGAKLIEKPVPQGGFNLNLGDANAISGGVHLADSHNVHNEDRSVHNITNTNSTVNNITQVAAQKTEIEILQEKKTLYLNECKRAYEDNVLEQSEVVALEECRIKLGLDKSTANTILESVRVMSERNARKTELNPIARTKLKILTDNLQKNEVKALMQQIDTLESLVNKYEHDGLRRKFYLVLAALKSEKCIALYENTKTDNYWNTFWSYLAYIKSGRISEAEDTLASLDRFTSYPEDNMTVLAVAGAIMMGDDVTAKELLNAVIGEYTPALQRFVDSIYLLLEPETAKEMGADENTCAFYLVNFFGQKDPKVKAEEERKRKEAEEAERRKQIEEEKKRKAEEQAKREAEEKKKAAEEARLKAEAERKRREKEEQRKKSSAYSVILLEDPENEVNLALYESDYFDYPDDFLRIQVINHYMESIPCEILSSLKQAEAESIKSDLEDVGAKVKICLTSEVKDSERVSLDMEKLKKLAKADEEFTKELLAEAERRNNKIKEEEQKQKEKDAERIKQEESERKAKEDNNQGNHYYNNGDHAEAAKWYRKAAEQGYAAAQNNLGECYRDGHGVDKDYAEAVKWFTKSSEQGYSRAQNNLGNCYYNGLGVNKDYAEAVKWYRKAVEQGYAAAQNNLGNCYYNGLGVNKDYAEAVKWYRKAAEQGYAAAQNNLGECYRDGHGVDKDYAEAVKWFRKAAEQGHARAQNALGKRYYNGEGVSQDYAEAVKWFRKAAEQGLRWAQCNLGDCYKDGNGVPKDKNLAKEWYSKAAAQGSQYAKDELIKLNKFSSLKDFAKWLDT